MNFSSNILSAPQPHVAKVTLLYNADTEHFCYNRKFCWTTVTQIQVNIYFFNPGISSPKSSHIIYFFMYFLIPHMNVLEIHRRILAQKEFLSFSVFFLIKGRSHSPSNIPKLLFLVPTQPSFRRKEKKICFQVT